jgi:hypothetical protein
MNHHVYAAAEFSLFYTFLLYLRRYSSVAFLNSWRTHCLKKWWCTYANNLSLRDPWLQKETHQSHRPVNFVGKAIVWTRSKTRNLPTIFLSFSPLRFSLDGPEVCIFSSDYNSGDDHVRENPIRSCLSRHSGDVQSKAFLRSSYPYETVCL